MFNTPLSTVVRRLFYAISPSETSFATAEEVPEYINECVPYFVFLVALEFLFLQIHQPARCHKPAIVDTITSLSAGGMSLAHKLICRDIEIVSYIWIYSHFNVINLPWQSPITWVLCFLGVDFAYYWMHRISHEVNFIWAAHQAHHSSEYFSLSSALRQSALQRYNSWIFFVPMALFIPPSIFIVHQQFNIIYQFWIHTELIGDLGPIEYIFNTASHHRVHHGRNKYCVDVNYGGTLIIWDRIFGTFAKESDPIQFGLSKPINTWDNVQVQFHTWFSIIGNIFHADSWRNKLGHIFCGPGWKPGNKTRLRDENDIPHVTGGMPVYKKSPPIWITGYVCVHFLLVFIGFEFCVKHKEDLSNFNEYLSFVICLYMIWTIVNMGYLLEQRRQIMYIELFRVFLYSVADFTLRSSGDNPSYMTLLYRMVYTASLFFWILLMCIKFKDDTSLPIKSYALEFSILKNRLEGKYD